MSNETTREAGLIASWPWPDAAAVVVVAAVVGRELATVGRNIEAETGREKPADPGRPTLRAEVGRVGAVAVREGMSPRAHARHNPSGRSLLAGDRQPGVLHVTGKSVEAEGLF
jgi:hypothetical protein